MGFLFSLVPFIVFVIIIITILSVISNARNASKNKQLHNNEDNVEFEKQTEKEKWEQTGREISEKIRNKLSHLFDDKKGIDTDFNDKNTNYTNNEEKIKKDNKCKNCGAELEVDKHGKKRCPYCQSKYF